MSFFSLCMKKADELIWHRIDTTGLCPSRLYQLIVTGKGWLFDILRGSCSQTNYWDHFLFKVIYKDISILTRFIRHFFSVPIVMLCSPCAESKWESLLVKWCWFFFGLCCHYVEHGSTQPQCSQAEYPHDCRGESGISRTLLYQYIISRAVEWHDFKAFSKQKLVALLTIPYPALLLWVSFVSILIQYVVTLLTTSLAVILFDNKMWDFNYLCFIFTTQPHVWWTTHADSLEPLTVLKNHKCQLSEALLTKL